MLSKIFNTAKANIKGSKEYPNITGTVYFRETKNGVILTAKIKGLPGNKNNCTGRFFRIPHTQWQFL